MSTLQVANLHFESTGNNRIQYAGSNVVNIVAGGANVITVNSTSATIAGGVVANGSVGTAGQVLFSGGAGANAYWNDVSVNVQTFTASGTWTKPAGATMVYVRLWGAGAGGCGGALGASSTVKRGGRGGGGGTYLDFLIRADQLGATESVTVGAGGTGGAGSTNTAGSSIIGTDGGSTSFAGFSASGGSSNERNSGEGNNEGIAFTLGVGTAILPTRSTTDVQFDDYRYNDASIGGRGGNGSTSGPADPGGVSLNSGGGGGGGGSESSGNTLYAPGEGGNTGVDPVTIAASGPSVTGGGGAAGTSSAASPTNGVDGGPFQGGGGGGSATTAANAGRGGNGGTAAGGGGGGTNRSGSATRSSGAGGNGGNGYAEIYSW